MLSSSPTVTSAQPGATTHPNLPSFRALQLHGVLFTTTTTASSNPLPQLPPRNSPTLYQSNQLETHDPAHARSRLKPTIGERVCGGGLWVGMFQRVDRRRAASARDKCSRGRKNTAAPQRQANARSKLTQANGNKGTHSVGLKTTVASNRASGR